MLAVAASVPPLFVINPDVELLNISKSISFAAFLLSAPPSSTINSSVPVIVCVISVSSDKSKLNAIVPELVIVVAPSKPAAVVTAILVTPEEVTKRPSKSTVTSPSPERPKVRIPLLVLKLALSTKLFVSVLEDDIVIELPLLLTVVSLLPIKLIVSPAEIFVLAAPFACILKLVVFVLYIGVFLY